MQLLLSFGLPSLHGCGRSRVRSSVVAFFLGVFIGAICCLMVRLFCRYVLFLSFVLLSGLLLPRRVSRYFCTSFVVSFCVSFAFSCVTSFVVSVHRLFCLFVGSFFCCCVFRCFCLSFCRPFVRSMLFLSPCLSLIRSLFPLFVGPVSRNSRRGFFRSFLRVFESFLGWSFVLSILAAVRSFLRPPFRHSSSCSLISFFLSVVRSVCVRSLSSFCRVVFRSSFRSFFPWFVRPFLVSCFGSVVLSSVRLLVHVFVREFRSSSLSCFSCSVFIAFVPFCRLCFSRASCRLFFFVCFRSRAFSLSSFRVFTLVVVVRSLGCLFFLSAFSFHLFDVLSVLCFLLCPCMRSYVFLCHSLVVSCGRCVLCLVL